MSRYDYGLRGPQDTPHRRFSGTRYSRYGRDDEPSEGSPTEDEQVRDRYNRDHLFPDRERDPTNLFPYGADGYGRFAKEGDYRLPYRTPDEVRTVRGTRSSTPYDYWDYERFRSTRHSDGI